MTNKNGSGKYFSIKLFEKRVIPFIFKLLFYLHFHFFSKLNITSFPFFQGGCLTINSTNDMP